MRSAIASFISRDLPGVASFILNEFASISRIFFNEILKKKKTDIISPSALLCHEFEALRKI